MEPTDYDKVANVAQEISFAFEDYFNDVTKRSMFDAIFERYLTQIDPGGSMIPYDAIIALWRHNASEYNLMINELKEKKLISA